jgi:hypothetical protein
MITEAERRKSYGSLGAVWQVQQLKNALGALNGINVQRLPPSVASEVTEAKHRLERAIHEAEHIIETKGLWP